MMTRAIRRSILIAAATLVVGFAGDIVYVVFFCPPHRAWQRVHDGRTNIVLDRGYRFATAGESTYVCTVPHAIGPVLVHQDLDCVCAPEGFGTAALGRVLNGTCVDDQRRPLRSENVGACRHAHCVDPIVPNLIDP
jgi:hypothetical protein